MEHNDNKNNEKLEININFDHLQNYFISNSSINEIKNFFIKFSSTNQLKKSRGRKKWNENEIKLLKKIYKIFGDDLMIAKIFLPKFNFNQIYKKFKEFIIKPNKNYVINFSIISENKIIFEKPKNKLFNNIFNYKESSNNNNFENDIPKQQEYEVDDIYYDKNFKYY